MPRIKIEMICLNISIFFILNPTNAISVFIWNLELNVLAIQILHNQYYFYTTLQFTLLLKIKKT